MSLLLPTHHLLHSLETWVESQTFVWRLSAEGQDRSLRGGTGSITIAWSRNSPTPFPKILKAIYSRDYALDKEKYPELSRILHSESKLKMISWGPNWFNSPPNGKDMGGSQLINGVPAFIWHMVVHRSIRWSFLRPLNILLDCTSLLIGRSFPLVSCSVYN